MLKGYWLITYIEHRTGFNRMYYETMKYKGFIAKWINKYYKTRTILNAIQLDKSEYEKLEI